MSEIHKFSLAYDTAQDRIAWDAEAVDGAATRLWLTQRLCKAVVKALTPMIQTSATPQHQAAVQSWEQAAAVAALGQTPAVKVSDETPSGLVGAVHLTPAGSSITVAFDFAAGQSLSIVMTPVALRQTLAVLHRLHVSAGWPTDEWPAWLAAPAAAPTDAVN